MRDQSISNISDLYKDVHGVRPRHFRFDEMSDVEIFLEEERLIDDCEEIIRSEAEWEKAAYSNFEHRIDQTIELGAGDRLTALRWLFQADMYLDCPRDRDDLEQWVYQLGFHQLSHCGIDVNVQDETIKAFGGCDD